MVESNNNNKSFNSNISSICNGNTSDMPSFTTPPSINPRVERQTNYLKLKRNKILYSFPKISVSILGGSNDGSVTAPNSPSTIENDKNLWSSTIMGSLIGATNPLTNSTQASSIHSRTSTISKQGERLLVYPIFPSSHTFNSTNNSIKNSLRTELRVARTIAIVVGCFIACWLPFTLVYILQVCKILLLN